MLFNTFMKTQLINRMACLLLVCFLNAHVSLGQGITAPRTPSPGAELSQTIGISKVTVIYSRPAVKGRPVWGELVPYGWNAQPFGNLKEAPWRTGANENTVIEFSHPAKVEGKDVPAGKYGLFFVINKDNSGEVILSKDYRSWGSFWYEKDNDQLRANIQIREVPHTELLTFDFINLSKNSGELVLNWEKKQFPVKVEFAVDAIVMANAAEELKSTVGFSWQGYSSAANYALQNKVNTDQALKWIDQAITMNRNFTTLRTKSNLLKEKGNTAESDALIKEAMTLATEGELNAYGYQLLGQGENDKAIQILTLNTEKFPKSANCWDSLGEAYAVKGDSKNAVKNFKKALTLNPPANVRANSEKFLKQLGAM
jgi:tetratricopeptide (TPR) repeat protein